MMITTGVVIGATLLFLLGVRLSAFFSGSETGFYRASFARLSIDANAGDPVAKRLMWFAGHPSYFVATTLVGNNVANYLTTVSLGLAAAALELGESGWFEVVGTLCCAPVVFIFGELLPKNLYYRAPLRLLRRDAWWFMAFYRLFLVVSFPLILMTRFLERFGEPGERSLEIVLGRSRLVQVLGEAHREGLLVAAQHQLIEGMMHTADQPVTGSMTPADRVYGVSEKATIEEMLDCARQFGLASVNIHRADDPAAWYGCVRAVDLAVGRGRPPESLIRCMPELSPSTTRLEALMKLRETNQLQAVIKNGDEVLGVVNEQGLVELLFRTPR